MKPILFAGRSSLKLAEKIARNNGLNLGEVEIVTFGNSEIKVKIQTEVMGKEVYVVQSTANPANDNLIELFLLIDALKRENTSKITVLIPYFGYARQNMQHQKGECVSLNVVVRILEALKVDKVITLDIHDEASSGIFNIPFENRSGLPFLAKKTYQWLGLSRQTETNFAIGSPDQGGVERARVFADHFFSNITNQEVVVVEKKRDLSAIHQSQAVAVFGEVNKKNVILVDDISTSGKTIINAAKLCLKAGAAKVGAVVVHPDFASGVPLQIEKSDLQFFLTTNSIEHPVSNLSQFSKVKVIEIADIFRF